MKAVASAGPSLLVTLRLDDAAAARFEALRRRYYPADRNRVPAHVMLFHRLPIDKREAIADDIARIVSSTAAFDLRVAAPRSIGSGIAYDLASPELQGVRASLAERWAGGLISQDRERYRPHVVVQNKVASATVRETLLVLRAEYEPATVTATAIVLWTYDHGLWSEPKSFAFASR